MYAKVFSQIYDGTLCTKGPWQALVTFQQLLVLADQDGNVDMTAGAIARRTTIPLDIIELGIVELLKEDPESRTPVEEGRRLMPLSEGRTWGWRIVNYKHYRDLKREEDRREYHRTYWQKHRSKSSTDSTQTQLTQPNQPIAEAKAEADTEAKKEKRVSTAALAQPLPSFTGDPNLEAFDSRQRPALANEWELPAAWGEGYGLADDRIVDCLESRQPVLASNIVRNACMLHRRDDHHVASTRA
jgi:hypothetical protein